MSSESARRAVIVMAKRPAPGRTKTRLGPALLDEQAAAFYEQMLLDTLDNLGERSDCTTFIAIDEPDSASYFSAIAPDTPQVEQIGNTLGDRLDSVLTYVLQQGFSTAFALSSDSPDLPVAHVDAAFAALERVDNDVVIGPTEDGGYYLIGWKQPWSPMVTDVTMSTPTVVADTMAVAEQLGARVGLAPQWYDIDQPADLDRLRSAPTAWRARRSSAFLRRLDG